MPNPELLNIGKNDGHKVSRKAAIAIVLVVLGVWAGTLGLGYLFLPDWEVRGQFGDLFGSINALFSGLAFVGLIYAILLQQNELSLQRKELQLQREEMQKSREELAEQANLQRKQLRATITEIHIRAMQVKVSAIEMESLSVEEFVRGERYGPQIRAVVEDMEWKISHLEDEISEA